MNHTEADLDLVAGQKVGSFSELHQTQVTAIWTEGEARGPQTPNPYAVRQVQPESGRHTGVPPHLREFTEEAVADGLDPDQRARLEQLLHQYGSVFSTGDHYQGRASWTEHEILLILGAVGSGLRKKLR